MVIIMKDVNQIQILNRHGEWKDTAHDKWESLRKAGWVFCELDKQGKVVMTKNGYYDVFRNTNRFCEHGTKLCQDCRCNERTLDEVQIDDLREEGHTCFDDETKMCVLCEQNNEKCHLKTKSAGKGRSGASAHKTENIRNDSAPAPRHTLEKTHNKWYQVVKDEGVYPTLYKHKETAEAEAKKRNARVEVVWEEKETDKKCLSK